MAKSLKNVASILSDLTNLDPLLSEDSDGPGADDDSDQTEVYFTSEESSSEDGSDDIDFDSIECETQKSADGTVWKDISGVSAKRGRYERHNVLTTRPGVTPEMKNSANSRSPLSHFSYFVNKPMMELMLKFTLKNGREKSSNGDWNISFDDLKKFLALVIARGVYGYRTWPVDHLWNMRIGPTLFREAMPRLKFREILRYLRFDDKSTRDERLRDDKFAIFRDIWRSFTTNCMKAFSPNENLTIDEMLVPAKWRWRFIQ